MPQNSIIAVLDFGSQTTRLITRRIRECGVLAKIFAHDTTARELKEHKLRAIILSGGPASVREDNAPQIDPAIFELDLPLLGICYGMQLLVRHFGGDVVKAREREFGARAITQEQASNLLVNLPASFKVWMSHCDEVFLGAAPLFSIAKSATCAHAAVRHEHAPIYGVQFHPEVMHTEHGDEIIKNFIFGIAKAEANFVMDNVAERKINEIKQQASDSEVIMALSGGVDSSVAAVLMHKAIGDRLHCIYVNHGLHREGELDEIERIFTHELKHRLHIIDARSEFFTALKNVSDPEIKRKVIGHTFIEVFERSLKQFPRAKFLCQGTLYSDVIESSSNKQRASHTIKTHHNVGGLPSQMVLKLIEPLRDLFKDEVRKLGAVLGLPPSILKRQPFPGPGLAVRVIGAIDEEKVALVRQADLIVRDEIAQAKLDENLWQWFAILLPVHSVGVMGDARSYGQTVAIRAVQSTDAMTADWARLPHDALARISSRITNEVRGITRVLYDITQKPPGTIEWE